MLFRQYWPVYLKCLCRLLAVKGSLRYVPAAVRLIKSRLAGTREELASLGENSSGFYRDVLMMLLRSECKSYITIYG